jgi:HEAT repeat protein
MALDALTYAGRPVAEWLKRIDHADSSSAVVAAVHSLADLLTGFAAAVAATGDPSARAAGIADLGRAGTHVQGAVAAVRETIQKLLRADPAEEVRTAAVQALILLGAVVKTDVPLLVATLRDESAEIRAGAARSLGAIGPDAQSAAAVLIPMTQYDPDPRTRVEAAAALWRIDRRPGRVLVPLTNALADPDELVRWVAADCLREMGPDAAAAVPALEAALTLPYRTGLIRTSVELALDRIRAISTTTES